VHHANSFCFGQLLSLQSRTNLSASNNRIFSSDSKQQQQQSVPTASCIFHDQHKQWKGTRLAANCPPCHRMANTEDHGLDWNGSHLRAPLEALECDPWVLEERLVGCWQLGKAPGLRPGPAVALLAILRGKYFGCSRKVPPLGVSGVPRGREGVRPVECRVLRRPASRVSRVGHS
jgi:hypothetical protein